jgi:maltodextrin utilization protein YvdJ
MDNIVLIFFLLYNLLLLPLSYCCYKTYQYVKYLDKCIITLQDRANPQNSALSLIVGGKKEDCDEKWIKEILESIIVGINDNNEDKNYKELIIVYMQIIKICKINGRNKN